MNILDLNIEELIADVQSKEIILENVKFELDQAKNLLMERMRLENLKSQLGNVSADDIAKIVESISISAKSISSEESVQLSS